MVYAQNIDENKTVSQRKAEVARRRGKLYKSIF